jgi:phage-related tail fiber protein
VSWNSQLITNLADPVNPQDGANKRYVDQSATGLSAKGAVQVASVGANLTLSGLQNIDGYTTVANDRVLVKDQTLAQNNGIYVAVAGAWTRALDMDTWAEVPQGYVFVANGTLNSNSSWVCNSAIGGTLGTTPITWVQFSQAAQVTPGGGLTRTGNSFDVIGTAGRIAVFADNVDIDAAYVGQTSITTLGSVATGTWNASTIQVNRGGTGATTLTGFLKGNGTSAFTAQAQLALTDVTGLGTMAAQNANAVAITGGTIDGIQLDGGSF